MSRSLDRLRARIDADPARRRRVEDYKRAMRDALALSELRESRRVTQQQVATTLRVSQSNVSRIEREEDVYLSTLRNYVEALAGRLEVAAIFPEGKILILPASQREAAHIDTYSQERQVVLEGNVPLIGAVERPDSPILRRDEHSNYSITDRVRKLGKILIGTDPSGQAASPVLTTAPRGVDSAEIPTAMRYAGA